MEKLEVDHIEDLERIQYCLHELKYDPTLKECDKIWRGYSESINRIFSRLPDSDNTLLDILKKYLDIDNS